MFLLSNSPTRLVSIRTWGQKQKTRRRIATRVSAWLGYAGVLVQMDPVAMPGLHV
jgi:hypothetical protein